MTCLLLATTGCGTSAYNASMDNTLNEARGAAPFRALFSASEIPDTSIQIRVPQVFKKSYLENSLHPDDGGRIGPDRFQPPFLPLPGMKVCYENQVSLGGKETPFYCYVAAAPGDAARLAGELQAALKKTFPETPDWQDAPCKSPDGKDVLWKKIRVQGPQPFRVKSVSDQTVAVETLPATFELWLYDAQKYAVLVGWRAPTNLEGAAPPPAGQKAAPAATFDRLDINTLAPLTAGSIKTPEAAAG